MLNVLILGAGHIAQTHCLRLAKLPGVEISAVVSRGGAPAAPLPGGARAHYLRSLSGLTALESRPDLAVICLPSFLHRQAVEELSGLVPNIICEKPAALCYEDGAAMAELARDRGCNLMVAQVLRVWDSYRVLADLLRTRRQTLHTLTLRRRQPRPAWSAGDWLLDETKSGGILYDLAIHEIDFVADLLGAPEQVSGSFGPNRESVTLLLRYARFCAVIEASWCLPCSYADGGMETFWEAVFTDQLAAFDSRISKTSYQRYDGADRARVDFPTWDAYEQQLSQMINFARMGQRENPFSIETALPALDICQRLERA